MENLENLKHPIGKHELPTIVDAEMIKHWISEIEVLPENLVKLVNQLTLAQLSMQYRPGGWTIRQVIHHVADSHLNAYMRFKLAITEENPTIRPYFEERWAETEEAKHGDIDLSINLIKALHKRWVAFLNTLKVEDFDRTLYHPEHQKTFTLKYMLSTYAWHGKHHLAQITTALK